MNNPYSSDFVDSLEHVSIKFLCVNIVWILWNFVMEFYRYITQVTFWKLSKILMEWSEYCSHSQFVCANLFQTYSNLVFKVISTTLRQISEIFQQIQRWDQEFSLALYGTSCVCLSYSFYTAKRFFPLWKTFVSSTIFHKLTFLSFYE